MASDLIFYTNPQSRGRIARWMLEEVGAPYETQVMDYASTMKGDAYRAINPMGKVPAIVHRGHVVTECAARSEEHTSELQSLMRISYAVFCLKKKNRRKTEPSNQSSQQ